MGFRIKDVRESKGMTQTELAEKSGVSRATIWKLETDADAITMTNTLQQLARALDVTVDELFLDEKV